MAAKNDITGDIIKSKVATNVYRENWDNIFTKPLDCFIKTSISHGYFGLMQREQLNWLVSHGNPFFNPRVQVDEYWIIIKKLYSNNV